MPDHPKIVGLSDGAFRIWMSGICYCNRWKTKGRIPIETVPSLKPRGFKSKFVAELVKMKLWDLEPDAYRVHDYRQWQSYAVRSEEEAEQLSKVRSEAGRRGMASRWHNKHNKTDSKTKTTPYQKNNPDPDPDPIRSSSNEEDHVRLLRENIEKLEVRYDRQLVAEARAVCSRTRKNGKMTDSVWLTTLETLDRFAARDVETAFRVMVEQKADQGFREEYMIGIARNESQRSLYSSNGTTLMAPPSPPEAFKSMTAEEARAAILGLERVS